MTEKYIIVIVQYPEEKFFWIQSNVMNLLFWPAFGICLRTLIQYQQGFHLDE